MKETSVRFTQSAATDLDDIWESIARDSQEAADRIIAEIRSRVAPLAKFPRAGPRRKDLARSRPLLFLAVGKYLIAYVAQRGELTVVRILHAARNIAAILRNERNT